MLLCGRAIGDSPLWPIVANCGQLWPLRPIVAVVAETVANCGQLWPISRGLEGFRAVFTVFVSVSNFRGAFAPFPPKIPIFLVSSGRTQDNPYYLHVAWISPAK